jgi:imidazole glycerol-phosphate synthase subunit HisF
MLRTRVIPCLQLIDESLVKTVKFGKQGYIGDPINTVRIFNELEVDELCFLDIRATLENRQPNFRILHEIADECFMPLSYGGGVKDAETARKILSIGFEKIVLNTAAFENPKLVTEIANYSGKQSVIGSIDIKRNIFGKYQLFTHDGTMKQDKDPVSWAKDLENLGAGELLITSMEKDGTWLGYDLDILNKISSTVNIPVIANGGAGSLNHIFDVIKNTKVSAVALGSMVLYQGKGLGVLVNFPDKNHLNKLLI